MVGFFAALTFMQVPSECEDQGFIDKFICSIQTVIVGGFTSTVDRIFTGFSDIVDAIFGGFTDVVVSVFDLVLEFPRRFADVIGSLFDGVTAFISELFDFGLVGIVIHAVTIPGVGEVPFIVPLVTGIILMGMGAMVVQLTAGGFITSAIGATVIVIGSTLIVWTAFPERSNIIFAGGAALILITAVALWILNVREGFET